MIVNAEALARLYTAFTAVFNAAFQETETWYERVAMTVPANTRIMDYKFLLDFPDKRRGLLLRIDRFGRGDEFAPFHLFLYPASLLELEILVAAGLVIHFSGPGIN